MPRRAAAQAFTLLELSVVIAIIALIAGGIFAGKSLVRSAKLESIVNEAQTYNIAIQQFKDKYGELPGDFASANKNWSSTTSGNGNGTIEYVRGDGTSGAKIAEEAFQGWVHLQMAGMVQGQFTGISGPLGSTEYVFNMYTSPTQGRINPNAPASQYEYTGWMIAYVDNNSVNSGHMLKKDYTQWIGIGSNLNGNDGSYGDDGFLTNADAYWVDAKMDDGKPLVGRVHGMGLDTDCTNTTNNTSVVGDYNLSVTRKDACALLFSYELVTAKR